MPTKAEADQEKLDKQAEKEKEAYAKDPEKATQHGRDEAFDRFKEGLKASGGLKEDINSMVHPDADDPVDARGSGKAGVPAGTEDYEKHQDKALAAAKKSRHGGVVSDRSTDPADKNAAVTVDPADGSKRTKDGVA